MSLYEEVIIAGSGGQGIILASKLLAQVATKNGKEVTLMPSYGAEVRGGTANCMIVISDKPIASPVISNPSSLIVMNGMSLNKFAPRLKHDGLVVLNSTLVKQIPQLPDTIEVLEIPADDIAAELGNSKAANMVMLGAYLQKRLMFSAEAAIKCLPDMISGKNQSVLALNAEALARGASLVSG